MELYPELGREEVEGMLQGALAATRPNSLQTMITARITTAAKETPGGYAHVNTGAVSLAAEAEFGANETRFQIGKRALGSLTAALQARLGRNVNLIRRSDALAALPAIRNLRAAVEHG